MFANEEVCCCVAAGDAEAREPGRFHRAGRHATSDSGSFCFASKHTPSKVRLFLFGQVGGRLLTCIAITQVERFLFDADEGKSDDFPFIKVWRPLFLRVCLPDPHRPTYRRRVSS